MFFELHNYGGADVFEQHTPLWRAGSL